MKRNVFKILALASLSVFSLGSLSACTLHFHEYNDGKSAYEVAVDNGFVGTEQEWLASLVGAQGANGVGVKDIRVGYEVGNDGETYTVFAVTYTDDSVQVIKTLVPKAVSTTEELVEALATGKTVLLTDDVSTTENIVMNGGTLDGNGKSVDGSAITERVNCAVTTTGGTVKNLRILGAPRGLGTGSSGMYALAENLTVENVYIDEGTYAINVGNGNGYQMRVSDSTLYGWSSYSGLALAVFDGCTFGQGQTDYAYVRAYDATDFIGCRFEIGFKLGVNADGFEDGLPFALTLTDCYYGDTRITAENFASLLTVAGDEDTESLKLCTVTVDGVAVDVESYS